MVWAGGWSDAEAERAVASAARIGYDILEIPVMNPDEFDAVHTKALLDKHNIKGAVSLGLAPDADISSVDGAKVRRGAACLSKALAHCATFGGDYLGGVIYSALTKYGADADREGPRQRGRRNSRSGAEAKKLGINLGLEAVNRYESNLLNTGAQVLRFVDDVGEDNVYVHLDTFHMNVEEADPVGAIELCRDRLGYFHVNENHRGYLGTGTIAFRSRNSAPWRESATTRRSPSKRSRRRPPAGLWRAWSPPGATSGRTATTSAEHALAFMKNEWEQAKRSWELTTLGRRRRD
jgi:D-psicose/D-tagatose/L-ribulose 3-epimerase